jgi:hypothetical protein
MRHLLTIRHSETGPGDEPHAGRRPTSSGDFARSMEEAGILIGAQAPGRSRDAGLPRQHGGSYLIDVATTEEALSWAARHPGAREGVIEVRPVWAWAGMG